MFYINTNSTAITITVTTSEIEKTVTINVLDFCRGVDRLECLFKKIRELQIEAGFSDDLAPADWREAEKEFKKCCSCYITTAAWDVLWEGRKAFQRATGITTTGKFPYSEYTGIYLHPKEPRFCGINAAKGWKLIQPELEERFGPENPNAIQNLSIVADKAMRGGMEEVCKLCWFKVQQREILNRIIQKENGSLLKTGKVLRMSIKEYLTESEISTLAGYVQDVLRQRVADTEVVKTSDDPGKVYTMGGNFSSCMRRLPYEAFEIYKDVGAKIAYIINKEGRLTARALLWDDVEVVWQDGKEPEHIRLMDTIYRDSSAEQAIMKRWAQENGYAWKTTQESYSCSHFTWGSGRISEDFELDDAFSARIYRRDGKAWEQGMYDKVPWIDIFPFAERGKNYLSHKDEGNGACLHSQDGKGGFLTNVIKCRYCGEHLRTPEQEEIWHFNTRLQTWSCPKCHDLHWQTCSICSEQEPEDEMFQHSSEWYCEECWNEHFVSCEGCGDTVPHDEIEWFSDEPYCSSCFNERFTFCEWCNEYAPTENVNFLINVNINVCDSCLQDFETCDSCGNMFPQEEVREVNFTREGEGEHFHHSEFLCEECREAINALSCDSCGRRWDKLDPRREEAGVEDFLCCECLTDRRRQCHSCGEWHEVGQTAIRHVHQVGYVDLCQQCREQESGSTYWCNRCNRILDDRLDRRVLVGFEQFCPECWAKEVQASMEYEAAFEHVLRRH